MEDDEGATEDRSTLFGGRRIRRRGEIALRLAGDGKSAGIAELHVCRFCVMRHT
jgi:hypothetical protein